MLTFSQRLKFAIQKKQLSQTDAAKKAGISQQSINYILNNDLLSSKLAPKLGEALGINLEWLIYGTGPFEEIKSYPLPILDTPYLILKYVNEGLVENVNYTTIDVDLGEHAFSYLIEPKTLIICTALNMGHATQFLSVYTTTVSITEHKEALSFGIFEWRRRDVNFEKNIA